MKTVSSSTIEKLAELEREMMATKRTTAAEALREAMAALVRPSHGWLTTGQAAERLSITIPTVKEWIRRGTLKGRPVGTRWWVTEDSVDRVLSLRKMLADMEEEGYPSEEEIYELTKKVRRQMSAEKKSHGG